MLKTSLIIFLILAVVAVGGGSFYYFEIYQPQTYAALLLSLYQKLENIGLQPDMSSLKDKADYEGVLKILEKRIILLESIQDELVQIQAPKRMVNIKKEFTDYLAFMQTPIPRAVQLASFMKKVSELQSAINDVYGSNASKQHTMETVKDIQMFLSQRIPRIQTLGTKLFDKEVTELTNPSFTELKLLWENASPIFDIMFKKINAMNQNLSISQAQTGNPFTPSEEKQISAYNRYLEEFIKKIENLIMQYSAYDILAFRNFPNISSTETSERALEFYQTIQTLKEQYAQ